MNLPFAEDVNYWRTGTSSPDTWLDKSCALVEEVGGSVNQKGMIWQDGRAVCLMAFSLKGDRFRMGWPVLKTRAGETDHPAARRQAATFMLHDVKAKVMVAKVMGTRQAFIANLLVTKNATIAELSTPELQKALPAMIAHSESTELAKT